MNGHTFLQVEDIKMDFAVRNIKMGIENLHNGNDIISEFICSTFPEYECVCVCVFRERETACQCVSVLRSRGGMKRCPLNPIRIMGELLD